jgi:hypothetical protein
MNPFATAAASPFATAPAAPVATTTDVEDLVASADAPKKRGRKKKEVVEGENASPKERAPRRSLNKLTDEDRVYILNNYALKDRAVVAQELSALHGYEIIAQQVYNVVNTTRKEVTEKLAKANAEGNAELAAKYQRVLDTKLVSKPFGRVKGESSGSSATPGGGRSTFSVDSILDSLL